MPRFPSLRILCQRGLRTMDQWVRMDGKLPWDLSNYPTIYLFWQCYGWYAAINRFSQDPPLTGWMGSIQEDRNDLRTLFIQRGRRRTRWWCTKRQPVQIKWGQLANFEIKANKPKVQQIRGLSWPIKILLTRRTLETLFLRWSFLRRD